MEISPFDELLAFIAKLEEHKASYRMQSVRDAIMVEVAGPGERWEVEFFASGAVEVERFTSFGDVRGREGLADLWPRLQ